MLPFGRMLEYGNIKPTNKPIRKIDGGWMHWVVLYEDGSLYGIGYNNSNQLRNCPVQFQYGSFVLLGTGVKDVWCGYASTIIHLESGAYIFNGNYNCLGTKTIVDTLSTLGGDDITNTMPPHDAILKMSVGLNSCHYIHTSNNRVYSRGWNTDGTVGTGSVSRVSTFTNSSTVLFKDVFAGQFSTIYKGLNDNSIYGSGTSQYGELGRGIVANSITKLDPAPSTLDFTACDTCTIVYNPARTYVVAGWQSQGQLANGQSANQSLTSFYTQSTLTSNQVVKGCRIRGNQSLRTLIYDGTGFYGSGNKNGNGVGIDTVYYTAIPSMNGVQIDNTKVQILGGATGWTLIFTGTEVYGTGGNDNLLPGKPNDGSSPLITIFTKIELP